MRVQVGPLVALVLLGSVAPAEAQPADDETAAAGEDARYRELLAEAIGEYDAGRYAEARALFRRAHERSPNARTLRGIGMAAFEMREYAEALRSLEAALAESRRPLTDEQRAHVQSLIERTKTYVGRFRVSLAPEAAELYVDDAPARLDADGMLILDLGAHALEARCPTCTSEQRSLHVRGGEQEEIAFELAPLEVERAEPAAVVAPVETQPVTPAAPARDGDDSTPILLLAGAAVCAAGAVGGMFWWLDRNSELDRCRNAGSACRNEEALEGERGVAAGATVGLAAAAIVLGMIGILQMGGDDEPSLACLPGPGGIGCAARF